MNRLPVAAAGALVALVACAKLAGLEDPDPGPPGDGADAGTEGRQAAPGIAVKPESVAITTSCAGGGDTAFITIENQNETPADYELQVPEGSAFALRNDADASVGSLKGTVPAKGLVLVYLRAMPTKAGTFAGQVIVHIGERVTQIPVQVTVTGGALVFSPDLVDFGEVRQQTTSQGQTIEITNTGTQPVNVLGLDRTPASGATAEFSIDTGGGSINIAPGEKATVVATLLPGNAGPQVTEVFEPRTQEPTCGALPTVTLKGTRVNQDVTVNPASLDFGEVDCMSAGGAARIITVSNYGNGPADFTATAPSDSWFEVTQESPNVPKANGGEPSTRTVTVKLKPVGATIGGHSEAIEVKVTNPKPEKTTTVTATVKSVGGVIDIVPTTLSGFAPGGTKSFGIKNTGNKYVYVRHTSSNPSSFVVTDDTNETALLPGSIFYIARDVKFVGRTAGTHQADIVTEKGSPPPLTPSSGNLCGAVPVVKVSATR